MCRIVDSKGHSEKNITRAKSVSSTDAAAVPATISIPVGAAPRSPACYEKGKGKGKKITRK